MNRHPGSGDTPAMAGTQGYSRSAGTGPSSGRSGWVVFAAIMLLIAGSFDLMWGLAAVLNDEVVTVGGHGVIVFDFTVWGWVHIVTGAIMIGAGWGLFSGAGWARWTAIGIATLSALLQIGVITTFPLWALAVIALDSIVIYQLTARWAD